MEIEELRPWCNNCTGTIVAMSDELKYLESTSRIVATLTERINIAPDDELPAQIVIDLSTVMSRQLAETNATLDFFMSGLRDTENNDKSFDSEAYNRHNNFLKSKYKFNDKI